MPGFSIPGAGEEAQDRPNSTQEVHRAHRFRLAQVGNIDLIQSNLIYIRDIDLPAVSFESEEIEGTAIKYKFAKMVTFDDLTLTFYDVDKIYDELMWWQQDLYSEENGLGYATEYKKQVKIAVTDGTGDPSYTIVFQGAWPKSISHSQLSYTNTELKAVTMTLSFDWLEIEGSTRMDYFDAEGPRSYDDENRTLDQYMQKIYEAAKAEADKSEESTKTPGK